MCALPRSTRRRDRALTTALQRSEQLLPDGSVAPPTKPLLRAFADRNAATENAPLRGLLKAAIEANELGMVAPHDTGSTGDRKIYELRRSRPGDIPDNVGTLALVDDGGILRWEPHSAVTSLAAGRRANPRTARRGVVVDLYRFEALEPAQLGEYLESLDKRLTPKRGLRELGADLKLVPTNPPRDGEDILLLVHGTFSNCDHMVAELLSEPRGRAFLTQARAVYDRVLAFDHPTLSVTPVMNAVDLGRLFEGSKNSVDVVAHSRGGLVARWWIEGIDRNMNRVDNAVLVGSPLAGTSLAAPPALRRALDLFTNVLRALEAGSSLVGTAVPLAVVVAGLAKFLGSVTKTLARTPVLDGAIAMVPGLAAQSRVSNNPEIVRLRSGEIPVTRYAAVTSDFEPDPVGWHFWRYFTQKPSHRVADFGADLIFRGANDLVVDQVAMSDLGTKNGANIVVDDGWVFDCGNGAPNSRVHHLNYFRQPDVIDFIEEALNWEKAK